MKRTRLAIPVALLLGAAPHASFGKAMLLNAPRVARTASTMATVHAINSELTGTVQGKVVDSTNAAVANAIVDLQDVIVGRIAARQLSDETGRFAFERVEPGTYVVEIVRRGDSSVLATSELVRVSGGDTLFTIVKLPLASSRFA